MLRRCITIREDLRPEAFVEEDEQELIFEASINGKTLRFIQHAWARCRQRGVPFAAVCLALESEPRFHHGDLVYCLTDRFLLQRGYRHLVDRLRGLTVVVRRDGVIRTVKWDWRKRRKGCMRRGNQVNWSAFRRKYRPR